MKIFVRLLLSALAALNACEQETRVMDFSESAANPEGAKGKKKKSSSKKQRESKAAVTASATSTASAAASADKPDDNLIDLQGESTKSSLRAPKGTSLAKYEQGDKVTGKSTGQWSCYVNYNVSAYAQPKDMAQAIREFTTMGYNMKPSWQDEDAAAGRFYGQLDKVKGAAVDDDITVKASVRTDGPKSLRISCYGATADADTLRAVVKSLRVADASND